MKKKPSKDLHDRSSCLLVACGAVGDGRCSYTNGVMRYEFVFSGDFFFNNYFKLFILLNNCCYYCFGLEACRIE